MTFYNVHGVILFCENYMFLPRSFVSLEILNVTRNGKKERILMQYDKKFRVVKTSLKEDIHKYTFLESSLSSDYSGVVEGIVIVR